MRLLAAISGIALAVLVGGCAGYRLGPSNGQRAGERTIQVIPFANRTLEPRVSDAATAALRKEIQREGTFQLVTDIPGEVVVTGEITQFNRGEISFLANDVVTARDYQVTLVARITARDRLTGRLLLDRDISGTALMRAGRDLPSAERQILPPLAADLARQITAALADGTW
jgi:hypothetical protein